MSSRRAIRDGDADAEWDSPPPPLDDPRWLAAPAKRVSKEREDRLMSDPWPDTTGDRSEEIAATAGQQILGELPEQVERLRWDAASLARYRSARLTETVGFAAEYSPWHAAHLRALLSSSSSSSGEASWTD